MIEMIIPPSPISLLILGILMIFVWLLAVFCIIKRIVRNPENEATKAKTDLKSHKEQRQNEYKK